MSGFTLARVVRIIPEAHAVDLLFLESGDRVPMVQVMSSSASGNSGLSDLADPGISGDQWDMERPGAREIIACVSFFRGTPVVQGFLFPQVCQLLFARKNFRVDRHPSDVYSTIDDAGNMEVYHPSGTMLRIGTSAAHEDLTGQDFDKAWKIERNTDKAVHVQLTIKNAGVQKASLNIDPNGNVTLTHNGNYTQNVGGNYTLNVTGTYNLTSTSATLATPVAITGATMTHRGKNVGDTHQHSGVTAGPGNTGAPI